MATLRSFAKKLRYFANDIEKQANEIKRAVAMEAVLTIVPATPVRSGQARSNFWTSTGSPNTTAVAYGPFTLDGYQSINRARQALQSTRPGEPVFITNNLPYIGRLNSGYSAQAPAQFVELAVAAAQAIIARQVIRYTGRE